MSITDPRDISGLKVWYSAEAETAYANNATMTGWTDLSGNANHAVTAGTVKPQWQSGTGPSAGPAVHFVAVGDGTTSGDTGHFALPTNLMSGVAAGEMFVQVKVDTSKPSIGMGMLHGFSNPDFSFFPYADGKIYDAFGSTTRKNAITPSPGLNAWRRLDVWSAASDYAMLLDETTQHATSSNTVQWNASPIIGASANGGGVPGPGLSTSPFKGWVTTVLVFSRKLTSSERADVVAWMSAHPSGGTTAAPPTTVTGGQGTEADSGQAGAAKAGAVVQGARATETDSAQGGTTKAGAVATGGQGAEADTGLGGATSTGQVGAGSQGAESDTPSSGTTTAGARVGGSQAAETDTAGAGTTGAGQVVPGSQGGEADAGQAGVTRTGAKVAGGQAAETDTAGAGSVEQSGSGVPIDLSTFVDLYASTSWDGTALTGSYMNFAIPGLVLDPADAPYVFQIDYVDAPADTVVLIQGVPSPDEAGVASSYVLAADFVTPGTGTLTLTVGPGIESWADAMSASAFYLYFTSDVGTITAIRSTPGLDTDGVVPDGPLLTDLTLAGGRNRAGRAVAVWSPAVVEPPDTSVALLSNRVGALAYSEVDIVGAGRPVFTTSQASKKRLRHRIVVGGKDVSFFRGADTPEPGYQLAEPLLWGPSSIEFPQIAACFEEPGKGALRWCRKGAPVMLQRVTAAGEIVSIDYRGVVIDWDVSGPNLRLEIGGHAQGRAALEWKPLPIFRDVLDVGRLGWAAIRDLGLRFEPRLGPTTGIKSGLWGGMDHLSYISELCGKAWQRNGTQWTIMPSDAGVYRMQQKDTETVDFTVFTDSDRAVPSLRSDAAEEPNTIYAAGVTPRGQRVRFGVYGTLKPGPAAPYPFEDGRSFGPGTDDEDTDTGDGVFVMIRKLWAEGYLSLEEADGTYDNAVAKAIAALQDDAELSGPVGVMTEDLWAVLWDINTNGFTLRGAQIEPAAQARRVRRYRRSASGAVIGKNPGYDPHALVVARHIDFGSGFTREQMREWSRAEIARGEDNWVGTIKVNTGGVLHGDVAPGATIDGDDVMDVRAIKPGMNARLPLFAGGILVHVSGVQIGYDDGIPVATLTVDTQARDAVPVWEIIRRNRETKRDPARRWKGNRASSTDKDSITEWDEVGGVLYGNRDLEPGWNVVPVIAGQEGTVSRIQLHVGGEDGREYACAVFGRKITAARLNHLIPAPLTAAGTKLWEKKEIRKALEARGLLYSAGTSDEPCGYSPGRKHHKSREVEQPNPDYDPGADDNDSGTDDDRVVTVTVTESWGDITGDHEDEAGFAYRTGKEPVLYLAVWVRAEDTLRGGRVMFNQLEAGA